MKIAIVCHPTIGGSGIIATELGLKLAQKGHEIHFISYEKPFRLSADNKNVYFHKVPINEYSLFKYPDYTLPLAVTISDIHHKFNLDIVHAHYAIPHATAALLAKDICANCLHSSPKVVTTLHGTDISLLGDDPSLKPIIRYSIEKSDRVTAVSEWLALTTKEKLCPKKEIEVIHNFYDPTPSKKDKHKLRWDLKLPANDFLLIHLSNLRPVKRVQDLLSIMKLLKEEKKIKLVIASGADFSGYLKLARKMRVENKIKVLRDVKDIAPVIQACNLGIFTSQSESFGLSILECMSYGLPVIATNVGGVPEVIQDKVSGRIYKVGDIKNMAKTIMSLRDDQKKYSEMSIKAKEIAKEFVSENIVGKYEKIYLKSMNSK